MLTRLLNTATVKYIKLPVINSLPVNCMNIKPGCAEKRERVRKANGKINVKDL